MNKSLSFVAGGLLILALALPACQEQPVRETDSSSEEISGGWMIENEQTSAALTDDERTIFERASAELKDSNYVPVQVLATQVVSGTNYAYLCLEHSSAAESETTWNVVTIYENLDGDAQISSIKELELANIHVVNATDESDLIGGWTIAASDDSATLPADAQKALNSAEEAREDVAFLPIALLGRQLVSGTNYQLLCKAVTTNGEYELYVVEIYEDLDNTASFTSIDRFDLLAYV